MTQTNMFVGKAKTQQPNPQIFTIWSNEIKKRIDPYFYAFKELKISNSVQIKKIAEVQGGYAFKSGEYQQEYGVPLVRIQNIKNGEIEFSKIIYINDKYLNRLEDFLLNDRDVLVAMTGATIGKVGRIYQDVLPAFLNQRVGRFIIDKNKINPDYLFYILQFDIFVDQVKRLSLGGSQPNISPGSIGDIKIPLPSLQIQNKIVGIMARAYQEKKEKEAEADRLLGFIDGYVLGELGIKILPAVAKAMAGEEKEMVFEVMSNEVEDSRIDAEYWQPFLEEIEQIINKGKYKTQKLKNFITKIHYGASTSNAYVDNGIPFLRILNLKPNHINISNVVHLPENFRKKLGNAFVNAGDLLISRSGTVGVVSVAPKEADGFAFGSFMIKFCLNDEINKEFVSIWLNNKLNKFLTEREKIGAIQGNITIGTIENFDIPIPSLEIQKRIADKAKNYRTKADTLRKEAKEVLQNAKEKVEGIILG
ncbi:restriction endonuclease subunit S [Patescibacteria group bacterium]|nr:restriction endonuclease subunit S [Patescibacteria group bacterium]MBU4579766.1 restriction endonuclease subunit S [Patescibacteria group bacterium]